MSSGSARAGTNDANQRVRHPRHLPPASPSVSLKSQTKLLNSVPIMMIPINVAVAGPSSQHLLPQFAQFGTDELVLIEMQGALEVQGDCNGQVVGKLTVDNETVSDRYSCSIHWAY